MLADWFRLIMNLGDFNYRVALPSIDAKELAMGERFEDLLQYDQLATSMQAGRAFAGFQEGPITFPPTYKYDM